MQSSEVLRELENTRSWLISPDIESVRVDENRISIGGSRYRASEQICKSLKKIASNDSCRKINIQIIQRTGPDGSVVDEWIRCVLKPSLVPISDSLFFKAFDKLNISYKACKNDGIYAAEIFSQDREVHLYEDIYFSLSIRIHNQPSRFLVTPLLISGPDTIRIPAKIMSVYWDMLRSGHHQLAIGIARKDTNRS